MPFALHLSRDGSDKARGPGTRSASLAGAPSRARFVRGVLLGFIGALIVFDMAFQSGASLESLLASARRLVPTIQPFFSHLLF
jgi:hypothetical protein